MKMIHLAMDVPQPAIWNEPFIKELRALGELTIVPNARALPAAKVADLIRDCDVALSCWGSAAIPGEVAAKPGKLKYACHITGTLRDYIPLSIVDAGILVTNWGDTPANEIAEGAMALLLAVMKDLHRHILRQRGRNATPDKSPVGGGLDGTDVGIYGLGGIGRRFIEMLRPFNPVIRVYDPFVAAIPPDCIRVETLAELFGKSRVVVIHAGLTDATRHSVTAELLARLPDHGILINTARGGIVDHDALGKEVLAGRLRAGLDVTEPEPLPMDHPLRQCPGCIITPHCIGNVRIEDPTRPPRLDKAHRVCLDNLRRFMRGEPVKFQMDRKRYLLST